jgi:hypothetical protein
LKCSLNLYAAEALLGFIFILRNYSQTRKIPHPPNG